jgi:hypothetical protein
MRGQWIVGVVGMLGLMGCATTGSAVGSARGRVRVTAESESIAEWRSLRALQGHNDFNARGTGGDAPMKGVDY